MAGWAGYLHKRMRDWRAKAITLLWYRHLFHSIGAKTSINAPLYGHQTDFISLGSGVSIGPSCRMETHPDEQARRQGKPILLIGDRVRIGHGVVLTCSQSLIIEADVLIAGGCYIGDNNHSIDPEGPRYLDQPLTCAATRIGKGAWLGQHVCVLAGAAVGERSVIGAGSVVKGEIPPYCIAVGAPARVVKRYSFETKAWMNETSGNGSSLVR